MKKIRYANLVMLELIHFLLFSSFQLCLALRVHQFLRSPRGEKSRRVRSIGQKVRVDPPSETYGPAAEENRKAKNQNFFKSDPLARRTVSSEQPEVGKHAPAPRYCLLPVPPVIFSVQPCVSLNARYCSSPFVIYKQFLRSFGSRQSHTNARNTFCESESLLWTTQSLKTKLKKNWPSSR